MGRTRLGKALALTFVVGVLASGGAGGQELPWLDGGRVRLDFSPSFWAWDDRFGLTSDGAAAAEALGMDLTADPLGRETLPYLRSLERSLGEALQDPTYRVRLGTSQALIEQSRLVFPFRLEVGVTDWLTVGAMVPLVRPRTELSFFFDADSLSSDVGLTPSTGTFLGDFGRILDGADTLGTTPPEILQARAYLTALSAAYSHSSVFPISGSVTGDNLQARFEALKAALESQGVVGLPETVPLAQEYLNEEGFTSLLASPGMQGYPLENYTRPWVLGDIEITASARVLRGGFDADSSGTLPFFRYQVGLGGMVRLGTGSNEDPLRFLDQDPADGQVDLEGTIFGLAEVGSKLGGWAQVRYGIQQSGEVIRRVAGPSEVLPPLSSQLPVTRTPGDYLQFDISPRFYFTPEMTFGLRYRFWSKGEDQHALPEIDPDLVALLDIPDADVLDQETEQTLHELGFSATYSTLGPHARGESPIPLQVRLSYLQPMNGSGGQTPRGGRLEAGLSLYRAFWGRSQRPVENPGSGNW